jgi:hypothetical protein
MTWLVRGSRDGLEFLIANGATMIGGAGTVESDLAGESPDFDQLLKSVKNRCVWTIAPVEVPRVVLHHNKKLPTMLVLEIGWPPAVFQVAERSLGRVFSSNDATFSITLPTPHFHGDGGPTPEAPMTYGQFVGGAQYTLSVDATAPILRVLAKPAK